MLNSDNIHEFLIEIKKDYDLLGIIFSYRDGSLIEEIFDQEIDESQTSAMSASVLDSAFGLAKTLNEEFLTKIIAELEYHTIVILKCGTKTFLTMVLKNDSVLEHTLEDLEYKIKDIDFIDTKIIK